MPSPTLKQQYELLKEVFENGKKLQYRGSDDYVWHDADQTDVLVWCCDAKTYRIKPEPREFWLKLNGFAEGDKGAHKAWEHFPGEVENSKEMKAQGFIKVREVLDDNDTKT